MTDDDKGHAHGRTTTDQSLEAERRKTDDELERTHRAVKRVADRVVADARDRADAVLNGARDREDRKLESDGASAAESQSLDVERAREDAAVTAERSGADEDSDAERLQRVRALASLLAFERQDTDLRLQIERARADEALTSREDFLAIVSHDLRTLLGGIALSAELLQQLARTDSPIAEAATYAERILRLSARMNRLVGDLMDVASIEAGKLSVVLAPFPADRLLADALEAFLPAATAQSISLTCVPGPELGVLELDHERIMQVLTNLVGNALKFTPKGGRISLRGERRGGEVVLSVEDSGEGVAADRITKIFDRFYQTHANDRRGLGLGLYIAKSIVEAHGGRIWVESAPGQGSTFHFTVPASAR